MKLQQVNIAVSRQLGALEMDEVGEIEINTLEELIAYSEANPLGVIIFGDEPVIIRGSTRAQSIMAFAVVAVMSESLDTQARQS